MYDNCQQPMSPCGMRTAPNEQSTGYTPHTLPPNEFEQEDFNTPAMKGTLQKILSDTIGQYVVVEFLIGTTIEKIREGILYSVGRNYIVLFEEPTQTFVICDIYAIKFVTYYQPGQRPRRNGQPQSTQSPQMW